VQRGAPLCTPHFTAFHHTVAAGTCAHISTAHHALVLEAAVDH
jgi:hypothetical protein